MDCSLPGSSVQEILQAKILEWVAVPSPLDLPAAGIEPGSPALQADSLLLIHHEALGVIYNISALLHSV